MPPWRPTSSIHRRAKRSNASICAGSISYLTWQVIKAQSLRSVLALWSRGRGCESIAAMSRALRPLACVIAAIAVAAAAAAVVLALVAEGRGAHHSLGAWSAAPFLLAVAAPASVGLFLALRQPGNRVAWILLLGPLSVALLMAGDALAGLALYRHPDSTTGAWAALVSQQWPVLFLWPLALAYLFPDGHLPSPRWRPFAATAGAACAGIVVLLLLAPEPETPYGTGRNPLPISVSPSLEPLFWVCWAGLLAALAGGAVALLERYRAGDHVRRRQ